MQINHLKKQILALNKQIEQQHDFIINYENKLFDCFQGITIKLFFLMLPFLFISSRFKMFQKMRLWLMTFLKIKFANLTKKFIFSTIKTFLS